MSELIDILLVDDEARNLDALEAILEDPTYRLLRAQTADDALRALLDHPVAAIVLDVKMPVLDGFELAKLIKGSKRFRQIPIVFLTAHMIDDHDVVMGYGAGAVDYLTKPVNPKILRHKIAVLAELFRKTRALAELNETLEARVRERTAELEASEEALRVAARQKDEFLATLAHELRNPLAPLRTGLDLLLRVLQPTAAVGQTLGAMNRQLDHMVRLIDDLLDVSRISRGILELKRQPADLAEIVENVIDACRPFLEPRAQRVRARLLETRPAVVDATRVAQMVGNLVHNASKFSPFGAEIRVELTEQDGSAIIRVVDDGVGVPEGQIERMFEMFTRLDPQGASAAGGLGIGLALARRLAELHGGTLTATSPGPGLGTTFVVALPLAHADVVTRERTLGERALSPGPGLDVAIIEDNDDAADTLALWLETLGHRVRVARTGI
ncbi:ATP-binding protein, partial [Myxococcota bacterium]|nr:ATP-binding protein [Myxococcota bacterium]